MRFLGFTKKRGPALEIPAKFKGVETYQVVEFEGRIVLVPVPFDPVDTEEIERLARETIGEHRKTLETLAG